MTEELPEAVLLEGVTAVKWHLLKGEKLADLTEVDTQDQSVASYAFDSYRDVATLMDARRFNDKNKAWVEKRGLTPGEKQAMKEQIVLESMLVVPDQFRAVDDDIKAQSHLYDLDETDVAVAAGLEEIRGRARLAIRSGTRIDQVREFVTDAVRRSRLKVLSNKELGELQVLRGNPRDGHARLRREGHHGHRRQGQGRGHQGSADRAYRRRGRGRQAARGQGTRRVRPHLSAQNHARSRTRRSTVLNPRRGSNSQLRGCGPSDTLYVC